MRKDRTDRRLASKLSPPSEMEQAAVNGGAGYFLRGQVAQAREVGGYLAGNGETILTTWHECTMNISSC